MNEEFTSGRALANMIADLQHDARVAKAAEAEAQKHYAAGRLAGLREAAEVIEAWRRPQTMKLHAGEMTAGESRAASAVLGGVIAAILTLATVKETP